jgi:hypothetical protein
MITFIWFLIVVFSSWRFTWWALIICLIIDYFLEVDGVRRGQGKNHNPDDDYDEDEY